MRKPSPEIRKRVIRLVLDHLIQVVQRVEVVVGQDLAFGSLVVVFGFRVEVYGTGKGLYCVLVLLEVAVGDTDVVEDVGLDVLVGQQFERSLKVFDGLLVLFVLVEG